MISQLHTPLPTRNPGAALASESPASIELERDLTIVFETVKARTMIESVIEALAS